MDRFYLEVLGEQVRDINIADGWQVPNPWDWADDHRIPTFLALIHEEVSEALTAFRKDDRANFEEELSDVIIRVVDLAHGLGIDLHEEIMKKLEANKKRGYRHGGKRI